MILAGTISSQSSLVARQSGGSTARSSSDLAVAPFDGVLDTLAGGAGSGRKSPSDGLEAAGASKPDTKAGPTFSQAFAPAVVTPALRPASASAATTLSVTGYKWPAAADGAAATLTPAPAPAPAPASATPASSAPVALATLLATLPAGLAEAPGHDDPASGPQRAGPGRDKSKTAPTPPASGPSAADAPNVTLSNIIGLAQAPLHQTQSQPQTPAAAPGSDGTISSHSPIGTEALSKGGEALDLKATTDGAGGPAHGPAAPAKDDRTAASPIIKSVTVETPLSASPSLPPTQQVIGGVQKLIASPSAPAPSANVTIAAPAAAPSRTVTLVLEPQDLGTVTVRLQLRGGTLDLQLDVSNSQTLDLLTKDRDSLTAAVGGQDYQVGTLTLRASDAQNSSQGNDHGSNGNNPTHNGSASQGDTPSQQREQGSQNGDPGASLPRGARNGGGAQRNEDDDQAGRSSARSASPSEPSGLYL